MESPCAGIRRHPAMEVPALCSFGYRSNQRTYLFAPRRKTLLFSNRSVYIHYFHECGIISLTKMRLVEPQAESCDCLVLYWGPGPLVQVRIPHLQCKQVLRQSKSSAR